MRCLGHPSRSIEHIVPDAPLGQMGQFAGLIVNKTPSTSAFIFAPLPEQNPWFPPITQHQVIPTTNQTEQDPSSACDDDTFSPDL